MITLLVLGCLCCFIQLVLFINGYTWMILTIFDRGYSPTLPPPIGSAAPSQRGWRRTQPEAPADSRLPWRKKAGSTTKVPGYPNGCLIPHHAHVTTTCPRLIQCFCCQQTQWILLTLMQDDLRYTLRYIDHCNSAMQMGLAIWDFDWTAYASEPEGSMQILRFLRFWKLRYNTLIVSHHCAAPTVSCTLEVEMCPAKPAKSGRRPKAIGV